MKKFAMIAAVAVLAAGCGSSSPNSPSSAPNTITFTAALNPANEIPTPVTNADATGRGTGTFTLNLTRDSAGTITAATATFVFSLSGFPNGTSVILTHIHTGGPTAAGSPIVNSGLTAATAVQMPNGSVTNQTFSNINVLPTDAQKIIDDPNGFYFNVHTPLNPGGAARGQLVRQ